MKRFTKRMLSFFLALTLVLSTPLSALAQEAATEAAVTEEAAGMSEEELSEEASLGEESVPETEEAEETGGSDSAEENVEEVTIPSDSGQEGSEEGTKESVESEIPEEEAENTVSEELTEAFEEEESGEAAAEGEAAQPEAEAADPEEGKLPQTETKVLEQAAPAEQNEEPQEESPVLSGLELIYSDLSTRTETTLDFEEEFDGETKEYTVRTEIPDSSGYYYLKPEMEKAEGYQWYFATETRNTALRSSAAKRSFGESVNISISNYSTQEYFTVELYITGEGSDNTVYDTYRIQVFYPGERTPKLNRLSVSGAGTGMVPSFDPDVYEYDVEITPVSENLDISIYTGDDASGGHDIKVNGEAEDGKVSSKSYSFPISGIAFDENGKADIVIEVSDDDVLLYTDEVTTYTLHLTKEDLRTPKLSGLTITGAASSSGMNFNPDVREYTLTADPTQLTLSIRPTIPYGESGYTVKINGSEVSTASYTYLRMAELEFDENRSADIVVEVSNSNLDVFKSEATVYTIHLVKSAPKAPQLTGIRLSGASTSLSPAFSASTPEYEASIDLTKETLTISPSWSRNESGHTVTVNGTRTVTASGASLSIPVSELEFDENRQTVILIQISNDNADAFLAEPTEYRITLTALEPVAPSLSGLTLRGAGSDMEPYFSGETTEYTAYLDPSKEELTVTVRTGDPGHEVKINGEEAVAGQAFSIPVKDLVKDENGNCVITVTVSNSNHMAYTDTEQVYTITLSDLPLMPEFTSEPTSAEAWTAPVVITGKPSRTGSRWVAPFVQARGQDITWTWYKCRDAEKTDAVAVMEPSQVSTSIYFDEYGDEDADEPETWYFFCEVKSNAEGGGSIQTPAYKVIYLPTPQISVEVVTKGETLESAPGVELILDTGYWIKKPSDYRNYPTLEVKADSRLLDEKYEEYGLGLSLYYQWDYVQIVKDETAESGYVASGSKREDFSRDHLNTVQPYSYMGTGGFLYSCRVSIVTKDRMGRDMYVGTVTSDPIYVHCQEALDYEGALPGISGNGSEKNPYILMTAEDLAAVRDALADGLNFSGVYVKLGTSIELDESWESLGTSGRTSFYGTFDGGGNQLTFAYGSEPLFKSLGGTLQNITIKGEYFPTYGVSGGGGTYINVTLAEGTTVKKSGFTDGAVTISGCTVENGVRIGWDSEKNAPTDFDGEYPSSGYGNANTGVGSFVGGMAGTITDSKSYATVYGQSCVGGIAGYKAYSMQGCRIENCEFGGEIIATGEYVGGILGSGYMHYTAPNSPCATVRNCLVTGKIKAGDKAGGIFGGEGMVYQCWPNGIGYITNNRFLGEISVGNGSCVGGIIGHMMSINKYNEIEGNYYAEGCGASRGIGGAVYVDTSCEEPTDIEGVIYIDTSKEITGEMLTLQINKANYNRTDDPLGRDADKLASMKTKSELEEDFVTRLEASGEYKTEYRQGEALDLTGMVLTAYWSSGKEETVSHEDAEISGFDTSSVGNKVFSVSWNGAKTEIAISVIPASDELTVTLTLLGDQKHGSSEEIHTLTKGNLEIWIPETEYTVEAGDTVADLMEQALVDYDMTWVNPSGNYVESITRNGVTLGQFTNGTKSGWMYTLNGIHVDLGVGEQYLSDGDEVVFHYTDDYTSEHRHSWKTEWSFDASAHWHECTEGCYITDNAEKNGYGLHAAGDWIIDDTATGARHKECTVCGYVTETEGTEKPVTPSEPEKPEEPSVSTAVGTVHQIGKVQYRILSSSSAAVHKLLDKSVKNMTVPETVTIGGKVFKVTTIGTGAYKNCAKLESVTLGKNVTVIGSEAFSGCTGLKRVKKAASVATINKKAFYNCKKLTTIGDKTGTITLGKIKSIGNSAFQGCLALKKVNASSMALTKVNAKAFYQCTSLTSFTASSKKLTTIGSQAFSGCKKLANVTLKTTGLKKAKVGANAFKGIKSTCTFRVPSGKTASYQSILKARGAGSRIKVTK